MQLEKFYQEIQADLNKQLLAPFQSADALTARLHESMAYSITNGGKRLRPLLVLATLRALNKQPQAGMASACGVEYIHTYSLIHDDLPAMDNDDYRRGKPSNHRQFDEGTAILAGDALLTYAFEAVAADSRVESAATRLTLVRMLAQAAGHHGMVAGQMGDIEAEGQTISLAALKNIHAAKTGALIRFGIDAGAVIAQAPTAIAQELAVFGEYFGIAYQIQNDLQEIVWTDAQRGKQAASDAALDKNTYPALLGTAGAIAALDAEIQVCRDALARIQALDGQFDAELMAGFLDYLKL